MTTLNERFLAATDDIAKASVPLLAESPALGKLMGLAQAWGAVPGDWVSDYASYLRDIAPIMSDEEKEMLLVFVTEATGEVAASEDAGNPANAGQISQESVEGGATADSDGSGA